MKEAVTLAKRAGLKEGRSGGESAGEGIVIGIGSGPAMDLAKAVADSLFGNNIRSANNDYDDDTHNEGGKLILAPSSMGGLWAASSNSPSLLLDTEEEMLMPHLTSSWRMESSGRRAGTVVALDQSRYLAMPPLYSGPKSLSIKNLHIISSGPSMAHVAGALLSIVLDAARSLDATSSNNAERESGSDDVVKEMKVVASLCASVLHLAVDEATNNGSDDNADDGIDSPVSPTHTLAQQHLLDAIPRLSLIIEQSSSLLNQSQHSIITHGTIPQTLANALLPSYFPQCHLVTYLACILPGFCDVLAASGPRTSHSNGEERILSALEEVAHSIINCTTETENNNRDSNKSSEGLSEQLSHWASEITVEAGIPTMASLAFGTPDLNSLVGSLDAHDALMASLYGGNAGKIGGGDDTRWIVEDVLQRSLNR